MKKWHKECLILHYKTKKDGVYVKEIENDKVMDAQGWVVT